MEDLKEVFLEYLVGAAASVLLLCAHQRRIAKSVIVAETLVLVNSKESCFWPGNLLKEILYPNPSKETLAKTEWGTDNYNYMILFIL